MLKKKQLSIQYGGCSLRILYRSEVTFEPFYMHGFNFSQHNKPAGTGWHKKWELLKNPTKIEEIKKKILTEIEPLQLAF